ncbi:MAG: DMT family transporter [Thermaerobacterales bacterium]
MSERNGIFLVIAGSSCFGALTVITRIAYGYGVEPLSLVFARNLGVVVIFSWLLLRRRRNRVVMTPGQHLLLATVGLLMGICIYAYASSVKYIAASLAVMIYYTYPALILLAAMLLLGERAKPARLVSVAMACAGVAMMVGMSVDGDLLKGAGFALLAASTIAAAFLLAARIGKAVPPLYTAAYTAIISMAAYGIAGMVSGTLDMAFAPVLWGLTVVSALIIAGASLLLFSGIRLVGAGRAAIACYVEPVVTILLSVLLLSEGLTLLQTGGAVLILAAIGLVHLQDPPAVVHEEEIAADPRSVYEARHL